MQGQTFHPNVEHHNMDVVSAVTSRCAGPCLGAVSTRYMPQSLMAMGIQLPCQLYRSLLDQLQSGCRFRCHGLFHKWCLWIIIWIVIGIPFFICGVLFAVIGRYDGYDYYHDYDCPYEEGVYCSQGRNYRYGMTGMEILGVTLLGVYFSALILYIVGCTAFRCRQAVTVDKALSRMNQQLLPYNLMATVSSVYLGYRFRITFVYYAYRPCVDYVAAILASSMPATQIRQEPSSGTITQSTPQTIDTSTSTTSGHVDNIANPEGVVMYYVTEGAQAEARKALLNLSGKFLRLRLQGKLALPFQQRHTPQGPCLCQFWENIRQPFRSATIPQASYCNPSAEQIIQPSVAVSPPAYHQPLQVQSPPQLDNPSPLTARPADSPPPYKE